jgi:hypothetical protein
MTAAIKGSAMPLPIAARRNQRRHQLVQTRTKLVQAVRALLLRRDGRADGAADARAA